MRQVELLTGAALAASFFFGGATQKGAFPDSIVEVASLALFAIVLPSVNGPLARSHWLTLLFLGLIVSIPLVQLIPLPPVLWSALPGRTVLLETYRSAGMPLPWLSISVAPWATERSALFLISPIAIFLGVLNCNRDERLRLWGLALLAGVMTLLLQIVQVADGRASTLRFHDYPNPEAGIGFFANSNHTAAFLYCLIPIAAYVYLKTSRGGFAMVAFALFNIGLVAGLVMTMSRTALVLGGLAASLSYVFLIRGRLGLRVHSTVVAYVIAAVVLLCGTIVTLSFGLDRLLSRFTNDEILKSGRWMLSSLSLDAAHSFFPFGSGLGTFDRVFPLFQTSGTTLPNFINHAHNDLIEILLETGLVGALAIVLWLTLLIRNAAAIWSEREIAIRDERLAALTVIILLFIHSLWDYPLRTFAVMALFAASSATLASARIGKSDQTIEIVPRKRPASTPQHYFTFSRKLITQFLFRLILIVGLGRLQETECQAEA